MTTSLVSWLGLAALPPLLFSLALGLPLWPFLLAALVAFFLGVRYVNQNVVPRAELVNDEWVFPSDQVYAVWVTGDEEKEELYAIFKYKADAVTFSAVTGATRKVRVQTIPVNAEVLHVG